jgi:nitroreductase
MQAIDALLSRRSARALTDPAPDEAALAIMFACAARAPDHGRLRPWRFVVVRRESRARFGELLAEHLRRTHPQASAETLERERLKALRAPLILVVAAHCNPAVKIPVIEQTLSAAAAAHAVMLAARALGFNAMWKTGGPAYDPAVTGALGLEPQDAIVGFLYLGTEVEEAERAAPAADQWRDLVRDFADGAAAR